jgi:undecaprenyl diphosphate synthase
VNIALAYGSRDEIVRAVNEAVERGEKVTEESFSQLLYTHSQPDPDLIIRTGKEVRLSNFLLYQAAYAELYFSDKMFPDFSDKELDKAILDFSSRTRRFGKTDEQIQNKK